MIKAMTTWLSFSIRWVVTVFVERQRRLCSKKYIYQIIWHQWTHHV